MKRVFEYFIASFIMACTAWAGQVAVDPELPAYKPAPGVSGSLKSVGSDTMVNLMTLWFEEFKKFYPNIQTDLDGKGSSTAPEALSQGAAQFGPMSREMKQSEIDAFERAMGHPPTQIRVAIDGLAVFVHKDCPLDELSLDQVQDIFSVTGKELTWGDLGVKDPAWSSQKVSLYGRNSASGTYGYFKDHALGGKDFKTTVKEQPGSSAVVQAVGKEKAAMGYSGIGYKTADVKALRLAVTTGQESVEPTVENCLSGDYPLARYLYVYLNKEPGKPLEPLRGEFVKFMLSRAGQETAIKDGYIPIPAVVAREDLELLGMPVEF